MLRVDIDGSDVEPELGSGREEEELTQTIHLHAGGDPESDGNPVGIHPGLQTVFHAVDLEDRVIFVLDRDGKW